MPDIDLYGMGRVKHVHFVGIGGAGMSGIAEVLHNLGYEVSGSDLRKNEITGKLSSLGVTVSNSHDESGIHGCDVCVVSSAIDDKNPEVVAAKKQRIPVIPRAEMLAELMRFRKGIAIAGTHGKTTTTSLVASILAEGGLDPTYVIGGLLNSSGSNAKLGGGEYLVAEADESDASFLHLQPVMAILTNIDADHLDFYGGDYNNLKNSFIEFINRLPFYGLAVVCNDNDGIKEVLSSIGKPFLTYGLDPSADYSARISKQESARTFFSVTRSGKKTKLDIQLNLPGKHNVLNSLAAIIVALELGVDERDIIKALNNFEGIARRCHILGSLDMHNKEVLLIDDYAHHPSEIQATMSAIRDGWPDRKIVVIFQPHRYSRTRDLFDDFCKVLADADSLLLMDIYPAGEAPIPGINGQALCNGIRVRGKVEPVFVENHDGLMNALEDVTEDKDIVLLMGAGDIGALGPKLRDHYLRNVH